LPAVFARVHPRTRTPLVATAIITALVLVLAAPLSIRVLADTTSFIVLVVYILVNLFLLRIKLRSPTAAGVRPLPLWVPVTGLIASGGCRDETARAGGGDRLNHRHDANARTYIIRRNSCVMTTRSRKSLPDYP
jgi:hypothetical protein